INASGSPVHVAGTHLKLGAAKRAPLTNSLGGPGVLRASEQAAVRGQKAGETGGINFPLPGNYREQGPLSVTVRTTPESALRSYRWRKRTDGHNWLLDVTVAPTGKGAIVKYEALVLVDARKDAPLPRAILPEVAQEAIPWTRSTACVQSGDPDIRK